jgi:WD40 repeat protein
VLLETNPFVLASGDDDGVVRLWDTRSGSRAFDFDEVHSDYIRWVAVVLW